MKQHRVRLGDVLDDFCPRCRLLMNHGVVGLVEGNVKKVRCLTCQFEHPFRHARSGRHQDRKKREMQKLYHQVLKGKNEHRNSNDQKHRPPVAGRRVRIARPEEPEPHQRRHKQPDPPAATLPPPPKGKGKVASWRKAWEEMQKKQQG